ncbi:DUF106 domain-containing protein [Candidatus Pacearchaeota archaeon]|nr:MAG: DUF106 domain-containing protein [Candidatus Pacearchaeota archaeon]
MSFISEFVFAYPRASVIVFSVLVSGFVSLVNSLVMDKEKMREMKARQDALKKEMDKHKKAGDHEKAAEIAKEMVNDSLAMMKHSFKPLLFTTIPILILFKYFSGLYSETPIASTWIWYYIGAAIVSGLVFRKLFRLP